MLRPGGRLALSDIVTEIPLPESVVCNATLWAACIGGAAQRHNVGGIEIGDDYQVLEGLSGNESVALAGADKLRDGERVKVQ